MFKKVVFLTVLMLVQLAMAQEDKPEPSQKKTDSIKADLKKKNIKVAKLKKVLEYDALAPSKAAFYSAILPGLGQIYNKRYWKAPIVWGGLAIGIYNFNFNNDEYNRFRDAFKRRRAGFTDDEFFGNGDTPVISDAALENAQENSQRTRDLWLVLTIGFYALNILDANVDAHLKQHNVDGTLGYDIRPYLGTDPVTGDPSYGMALTLNF